MLIEGKGALRRGTDVIGNLAMEFRSDETRANHWYGLVEIPKPWQAEFASDTHRVRPADLAFLGHALGPVDLGEYFPTMQRARFEFRGSVPQIPAMVLAKAAPKTNAKPEAGKPDEKKNAPGA